MPGTLRAAHAGPPLSGGQRQRVALARALVLEPKHPPARRAARRHRSQAPQGDAARAQAAQPGARHDLRVRHARSGRGAHDVRPHRGHGATRASRSSGARPQIYENPRTTFVAKFIGESNFFDGLVRAQHSARLASWTPTAGGQFVVPEHPPSPTGNASASRCARSGSTCSPRMRSPRTENAIAGAIRDVIYLGETMHVLVKLPGERTITVALRNEGQLTRPLKLAAGDEPAAVAWKFRGLPGSGGPVTAPVERRGLRQRSSRGSTNGPGDPVVPARAGRGLADPVLPGARSRSCSRTASCRRGSTAASSAGSPLEHYLRFGDRLYLAILWRTIVDSTACTVICLLLGYPTAYVIARGGKWKDSAPLPRRAPVLDELPRPDVRDDLPHARRRLHQHDAARRSGSSTSRSTMLYTPFAVHDWGSSTASCRSWSCRSTRRSRSSTSRCSKPRRCSARGRRRGSCAVDPAAVDARRRRRLAARVHPGARLVPHLRPARRREGRS